MASLAILVYRTFGTAMRATAQNAQVAGLMGIDINRVIAVTFVIGAGLGAVAASSTAPTTASPSTRWARSSG